MPCKSERTQTLDAERNDVVITLEPTPEALALVETVDRILSSKSDNPPQEAA